MSLTARRKRRKVLATTVPTLESRPQRVFSPRIYSSECITGKAIEYSTAVPYRHVCVDAVCEDIRLREVLRELEGHLTLSFKETDLFKVLQSVDIASITEGSAIKCGNLIALRNELYSEHFRRVVEQITGCPTLDSRVDCSCNVYPTGGHLLCHDDVIGTRCISYILYLSEPDDEWTEDDGGALELYSTTHRLSTVPESIPSKGILPRWNTMVIFGIEPGKSFHAVQEVFAEHKSRVSISGWYHVKQENQGTAKEASAQTLLHGTDVFTEFSFGGQAAAITEQEFTARYIDSSLFQEKDRESLRRWVNNLYLEQGGMLQLKEQYARRGSILLRDFLSERVAMKVKERLKSQQHDRRSSTDFDRRWVLCGPPHVRRYLRYKASAAHSEPRAERDDLTATLNAIKSNVFESSSFERWLSTIFGSNLWIMKEETRCFRPGWDYTVAIQQTNERARQISMNICFVDDFDERKRSAWSSGEVGGYVCHVSATGKSQGPAEVYDAEDDDGVLSVNAEFNSLSFVECGSNTFEFVKYVSNSAPSPRWDISVDIARGIQ